jgi:hypothetical protein
MLKEAHLSIRLQGMRIREKKKIKSRLWTQRLEEVLRNPYDYESKELFLKEASSILNAVYKSYDKYFLKFRLDKRTKEKAIWMLHLDALDTLRDCVFLLKKKKHRIVGKLFRDVTEVLDLAALFWWECDKHQDKLRKWYDDKVIPHSEFRQYLKRTKGESFSKTSSAMYSSLSRWTHHCYSVLLSSYSRGSKEDNALLMCDSHFRSDTLILPQIISQYAWEIKDLILYFLSNVKMVGLVDWEPLTNHFNKTIRGIEFH